MPKAIRKSKKPLKVNRRKEIIKTRANMDEIENLKKIIPEINEAKSRFFEKISKIDKHLARLITKERD